MSDEQSGKGVVAGGGMLAILASVFAHGADDCARVGARGAAASHVAEQGARVGAEVAVGAKGAGLAVGDGTRLGAQGARVGAQGAGVGAQGVGAGRLAGRVGAEGAGRAAGRGVPMRAAGVHGGGEVGGEVGARLSTVERAALEEAPGYALNAIDLAGGPDDDDDTAAPATTPPAFRFEGKATYLPFHSDFILSRPELRAPVDVVAPPLPGEGESMVLGMLRRGQPSPVILTARLDASGGIERPARGSIPLKNLFARCHSEGLACFLVACLHGASRSCTKTSARVWHAATEALARPPGDAGLRRAFSAALLQARGRIDVDRQIMVARSPIDGESRPIVSAPAAPATAPAASASASAASAASAPPAPRR